MAVAVETAIALLLGFPVWIVIMSVALMLHRVELPTLHRAAPAH